MNRQSIVLFVALLVSSTPAFSWPTQFPTGTTLFTPRAQPGYILFAPLSIPVGQQSGAHLEGATVYLINLRGEPLHTWKLSFYPLNCRLLENGNLAVIGQINKNSRNRAGFGKLWMGGAAGRIEELTWEGKSVFVHEDLNMHHDYVRLPNGHYMYLTWEPVPIALQSRVRGGVKGSEFPGKRMFNDTIVEVDEKGKVVWSWRANEHLDPDIDIIGPIYRREEWLHGNSLAVLNDGNVAVTSRSTDSVIIIDKKSKKVIFRWGNTSYLDKATGRIEIRMSPETLGGPHAVKQIPAGEPGAGNLTLYDNGIYKSLSRVVEIDLASRKLVWESRRPGVGRAHFSDIMGGAQRLPNGNTLVCEGVNGRLFQLTPSNEIVWEYINPFTPQPTLHGSIFDAHQYPTDYCPQFKDIKPKNINALESGATPHQNQGDAATLDTSDIPPDKGDSFASSAAAPALVLIALLLLAFWKRRKQDAA